MAGVVCQHCGTTNPAGARFCSGCDGFLDWDGTPEQAEQPEPTPQRRPSAAAPPSPVRPSPLPPSPLPPAGPAPLASPPQGPPTLAETPRRRPPADPRAETTPYGPTPQAPLPVTVRQCYHCGLENPLQRRFCRRCGAWLVDPTAPVAVAPLPLRGRLRQRWWGGPRTAYQGSLSRSTVVFRALSVTAALLVVGLLLGVAGFNPVTRARDYVGHVRGSGRIADVQATADPAEAVDDHPAAWATDDVRGRGWTTLWTAAGQGDPEAACVTPAAPAVANTLVIAFPSPANVREIGIEAGLAEDDPLIDGRWRPRTLELRWDGGGCQRVDLEKTPALQRFRVDEGDVRGVRITVVAGYEPTVAGQTGADRLDIAEVTFWQR